MRPRPKNRAIATGDQVPGRFATDKSTMWRQCEAMDSGKLEWLAKYAERMGWRSIAVQVLEKRRLNGDL